MYAYLTITAGERAGSNIVLNPDQETRLGRGPECTVVLADTLCSRVHATIRYAEGRWLVRDAGSRNGTYVNGARTDEAILDEGHTIRLGASELVFHTSDQPPTVGGDTGLHLVHSHILDAPLGTPEGDPVAQGAAREGEQHQDLLLLYQFCLRLLGARDVSELMQASLELLRERTRAGRAAFLLADASGRLQPRCVMPRGAGWKIELSESLARLVVGEGHAVWMAAQESGSASLVHGGDALWVPLVHNGAVLGALHVVLDQGRFRPSHFDFAISMARGAAAALERLRRQEALAAEAAWPRAQVPESEMLIARSPEMQAVWNDALRVAPDACLLLQGETGTGKEFLARLMHRHAPSSAGPLVVVHCAEAAEQQVESRLFGHRPEDCAQPDCDHRGLVERAGVGTLLLKEVAALSHSAQAKLLRLIQGAPLICPADGADLLARPRVVAISRKALSSYVQQGTFREDLYRRLSVHTLNVPPLRDRPQDIEPLLTVFLEAHAKLHGKPGIGISAEARERLLAYHWPGNVRQLRCVIDCAVAMAVGAQLEAADLVLPGAARESLGSLRIDDWERRLIAEALARAGGHVPQAASLLGIGRATLYRKCEEYGIRRGEK